MGQLFKISGFLPYILIVFLNAFVDLGHKIIIQNTVFKTYDGPQQIVLTAIVNALILLPFILLFTPSGYLSDKYPKNRVMRISAWIAVVITLLITLFYRLGQFEAAFAMTFLLAVQSAFYSPAKYGYIKELTGNSQLTAANGLVQAVTTIAILAGTFVFSILFEARLADQAYQDQSELLQRIAPIGWLLVSGSVLELILAYTLPQRQDTVTAMRFDWRGYIRGQSLGRNLGLLRSNPVIQLSIIGLSIFWAISQVVLAAFPAYAKAHLAIDNTVLIQGMLACAGIGIMLGSLIAGRASRNHIETGLIPIGALGVAASLSILPGLNHVFSQGLNFIALGLLGGLFIIPLNALIQFHAREHELGTILAGNNMIQNIVMLAFLALTVAFTLYGVNSLQLFTLLTVVALGGAFYTLYKIPQSFIRLLVRHLMASRYRLQVLGFDNLPSSGGVLMLGNHISWIDWAVVQMACPRPVRFVMERGIYERWYLKWFLDLFGVIPISGGAARTALEEITRLLNRGQVVCLFPEGTISRTGQLSEFHSGYERAAAEAEGVILPFYLRGLWGSRFSRSSDKLKGNRKSGARRDLIVAFGSPLPMNTTAKALKQKVFELSVDSWERYTRSLPTLPVAWLDTLGRQSSELAVADVSGADLSRARFATACLCLARLIRRRSREQNIGLLLPTGSAGAMANMAVLLCGRTIVNLNYSASREALQAAVRKADIATIYSSRKFLEKLKKKGIDLDGAFPGAELVHMEDLAARITPAAKLLTALAIRLLPGTLLKWSCCTCVDPESPAAILFSSGSEGEPKGVMLSHRNILANVKQISDVLNTEDSDVVMASLPLFHAFGLTVTTFMPLIEDMPMVCHPDPTDAVNIAKGIARYRATIFCGTSTFLRLYCKNRRIHPLMLESLRIVVAGAEKLSPDVREAFKLKFNKDIYEGYGATETTPVASVNIPDHLDTTYWKVQLGSKPGTVGMPLPGSSFRIVDPDTLEELPRGEDGLILIGGTQVMLGYLKDPEKTAAVITEIDGLRWYKTGDKGHLDEDGFLIIVDRYSRFAKLGGEMISLTAVEDQIRLILKQPELELVAVNLPDEKKGEKIVLLIAAEIDLDGLRKALLEAGINPLMLPAELRRVAEIPKLGSGKTDFKAARKLAMAAA